MEKYVLLTEDDWQQTTTQEEKLKTGSIGCCQIKGITLVIFHDLGSDFFRLWKDRAQHNAVKKNLKTKHHEGQNLG